MDDPNDLVFAGGSGWPAETTTSSTNVCPPGYQITNANGTTVYSHPTNQFYSLYATENTRGIGISGLYADGYCD